MRGNRVARVGVVIAVAFAALFWVGKSARGQGRDDGVAGYHVVPELQKLVPSDISSGDEAGRAVAVGDDVVAVGARYATGVTADTGAVYLYQFDGHTWKEVQKLFAWDGQPFDEFGHSIAVDGDIIAVGARRGDGPTAIDTGSAYIYRRHGSTWSLEARLAGSDKPGAEFGYAVDVEDDRVVIGALRDDGVTDETGAAYVYSYRGGAWSFEQRLIASDGELGDAFGSAVAVDADSIAVGAYLDWSPLNWAGSVSMFDYDGSRWVEGQKLTASNGWVDDRFGISLDLAASRLIVGAYRADAGNARCDQGLAYAFGKNGSAWAEVGILAPPDPGCGYGFGLSVAMNRDLAVVGSFLYQFYSDRLGAAYAYHWRDGAWAPEAKFLAGQGRARDMFGTSVAVSSETVAVGAFHHDAVARDCGAAYIYVGPEWERYGEGTPGQNGIVPVIEPSSDPYLGNQDFSVILSQAYPSTVGMLLLGFAPMWQHTNDWTLLVDITGPPRGATIFIITGATGDAIVDLPIPNNAFFDGLGLYFQALVADPFAAGRIAATDGLKLSMFHQ